MIKLIVSDVDGTLVEDGSGGVNPELFEVILNSVCDCQRPALGQR